MDIDRLRVIAFCGSPRVEGNTHLLLKEALRPAIEGGHHIEQFWLNGMAIKPCQNCGGCEETGVCVIMDDMDKIYRAIRVADRIIIASPVFFSSLSAQTKIMIDRCQPFWSERYLLKREIKPGRYGRKGLLLVVGAMKNETGIRCCEATARAFFRSVSVPEHEWRGFTGIDKKGAILLHKTALEQAYFLGKGIIRLE
jgi:multimeric flavodoxin WrbA